MTDGVTISLTPRAAAKLREFAAQRDIAVSIRLDVIGGAASGLAYDLYFAAPGFDDHSFESEGICVTVRRDCVALLHGSIVDWSEGVNGAGFQVINPNLPRQSA